MNTLSEIEAKEDICRKRAAALPDSIRKQYYEELELQIKDPDTYAVLCWFFIVGLHHFYMEDYLKGTRNLLLMIGGIALFAWGGWILVVAVMGLEIYNLAFSQTNVAHYNLERTEELLEHYEKLSDLGEHMVR